MQLRPLLRKDRLNMAFAEVAGLETITLFGVGRYRIPSEWFGRF